MILVSICEKIQIGNGEIPNSLYGSLSCLEFRDREKKCSKNMREEKNDFPKIKKYLGFNKKNQIRVLFLGFGYLI